MKRWFRRITIGLGIVVGALILGVTGLIFSFWWSVPSYDTSENVAGLGAPATIRRDRNAIPHILARSHDDAAFGLGYAHAQDRLFQMEMSRR
jgi:penicillin amidase